MEITIPHFTKRETDVITYIKKGLTSKSIGIQLGISRRTVEIHRSNILRKLGIYSPRAILLERLKSLDIPQHN